MATVGQDIFKPTKFGGKYTVTLIPGTRDNRPQLPNIILNDAQVTVSVLRSPSRSRRSSRQTMFPLSGSRSTSLVSRRATSTPRNFCASLSLP